MATHAGCFGAPVPPSSRQVVCVAAEFGSDACMTVLLTLIRRHHGVAATDVVCVARTRAILGELTRPWQLDTIACTTHHYISDSISQHLYSGFTALTGGSPQSTQNVRAETADRHCKAIR
jgi:hypothetical protein